MYCLTGRIATALEQLPCIFRGLAQLAQTRDSVHDEGWLCVTRAGEPRHGIGNFPSVAAETLLAGDEPQASAIGLSGVSLRITRGA